MIARTIGFCPMSTPYSRENSVGRPTTIRKREADAEPSYLSPGLAVALT
jgi:hypothetical protein